MKYLLFILLFVSCTGNCPHGNPTTPKRQYVEEICPKCKGTGSVEMSTGQKAGLAICTLGMGLLCDETECETCNGTGIVKIPVPKKGIIEEWSKKLWK